MHRILQSRVLYYDAMKEQAIHVVLLIAFSFAYSVYCMPVYYINYKDLALICCIKRKQLIQSWTPTSLLTLIIKEFA